MLKEIKYYKCTGMPNFTDIKQAIELANKYKCIIRIEYHVVNFGQHTIDIEENSITEYINEQILTQT